MTELLPNAIAWLFLDLNSYFASVEQQCRPELRGKPVAVVPLETDATCAIAASYEAKAFGIKTGASIYEAKQLCPQLVCIKADHERYVEYHHRIIEEIERHIPVTYVASIDEVACELDRSEQHVPTAIALAKAIKSGIYANVGEAIGCSVGLAPNRFLAKVATELQKPDGLVVVRPEDIPHKLLGLEFSDIPGIGRAMQQRLQAAGVVTMEQLYGLSAKHMRAIWHNVGGEVLWYALRGVEIAPKETQRRTVGHSHVLAPENRPLPQAAQVGKRLLLKAASRLRRMEHCAGRLHVSVRVEKGERLQVQRGFSPHCDNVFLSEQWADCWAELTAHPAVRGKRIKKISVSFYGLVKQADVQPDLFDQPEQRAAKKNEKLSAAMDALNSKFGRNTVTTADTLGEANVVTGTKIAFARIPDKAEFHE